jgi:hypothetical protein
MLTLDGRAERVDLTTSWIAGWSGFKRIAARKIVVPT